MRLTLRTLLAWRDGLLDGADEEEIRRKVESGEVPRRLLAHIEQLERKAELGSPKLEGRGLAADANTVAEYLENKLPTEQLEAFERICLESDVHLAEVAECHYLLARFGDESQAGDGTLSSEGLARRVGDLLVRDCEPGDHPAEATVDSAAVEAVEVEAAVAGSSAMPAVREQVTAPAAAKGSGRRPRRGPAWLKLAVAVGSLAALLALFVVLAGRGWRPQDSAGDDAQGNIEQPAEAVPPADRQAAEAPQAVDPPEPSPEPAEPPPAEPAAEPAEPPAESVASDDPADAGEIQPSAASPPGPPPAPPSEPKPAEVMVNVPGGNALAIASRPQPPRAPEPPAPAESLGEGLSKPPGNDRAAAAAPAAAPLGFVGTKPIILHRVGKRVDDAGENVAAAWQPMADGAALGSREELLVPPWFEPEINVRGVTVRLLDSTQAIVSLGKDGTPRLEVVFGRAVVRSARPQTRLQVVAGDLVGTLEDVPVRPVGIEVTLERQPGGDPFAGLTTIVASIVPSADAVGWVHTFGSGPEPTQLSPGDQFLADGTDSPRLLRNQPAPAWLQPSRPIDRIARSGREAFVAGVRGSQPLSRALRELSVARDIEDRIVASATLALLGEYRETVELLVADTPPARLGETRWREFEASTVPLALARGANAAARFRQALEAVAPHGTAAVLERMAVGFSPQQAAAGEADFLIEALASPHLVVRRYAYRRLCELVEPTRLERLKYRPDGLEQQRTEGVRWWRDHWQNTVIPRLQAGGLSGRQDG